MVFECRRLHRNLHKVGEASRCLEAQAMGVRAHEAVIEALRLRWLHGHLCKVREASRRFEGQATGVRAHEAVPEVLRRRRLRRNLYRVGKASRCHGVELWTVLDRRRLRRTLCKVGQPSRRHEGGLWVVLERRRLHQDLYRVRTTASVHHEVQATEVRARVKVEVLDDRDARSGSIALVHEVSHGASERSSLRCP